MLKVKPSKNINAHFLIRPPHSSSVCSFSIFWDIVTNLTLSYHIPLGSQGATVSHKAISTHFLSPHGYHGARGERLVDQLYNVPQFSTGRAGGGRQTEKRKSIRIKFPAKCTTGLLLAISVNTFPPFLLKNTKSSHSSKQREASCFV